MSKPRIGQTLIGQYRVEARAAPTPLGDLYRAVDVRTQKYFALIVLPEAWDAQPELIKKLIAGSLPLQRINHPNLIPFLGIHQTAEFTFILEEWIDGPSLRDVLESQPGKPLGVSEAITYAKALSEALEHLRANGFAHLDLSPDFIHIDPQGNIKLGGLATCQHLDDKSAMLPAPYLPMYGAPEQYHRGFINASADVYPLSAITFELLTGRWLTDSNHIDEEVVRRVHTYLIAPSPRIANADVPDFLSRVVIKGLSKKPDERQASPREFFLSVCMALKVPQEAIANKITREDAPITQALLDTWKYLKPPTKTSAQRSAMTLIPSGQDLNVGFVIKVSATIVIGFGILIGAWMINPPSAEINIPKFATLPPSTLILPTIAPSITPQIESRDERRIMYTCERGNHNQICIINADGTGLVQLTTQDAESYYPAFAPDGKSIVYASSRAGTFELFLAIIERREMYQLTSGVGNMVSPDFSPDGSLILFANKAAQGPTSLWTVESSGKNAKPLYVGPNTIVSAAWSPDGSQIAFVMAMDQSNTYGLYVMNADTSLARRISHDIPNIGGSVDWSTDGKSLLFFAGESGKHEIYLLELETGKTTKLTNGGNNVAPSFSSDGKWIVFNSDRNGNSDIFIMRADGSELKQITNDPGADWQAVWEP
jgi:TolB protein